MKLSYLLPILLLFISCSENKTSSDKEEKQVENREIVMSEFQTIIDSANIEGAILIYDLKEDTYYSNNFEWTKKGKLPASTFKIANSIIALETEIVKNDSTIFKWDGKKRNFSRWEQDLTLRDAFHFSCVPCYQEVARDIGAKKMNTYLAKLDYGDIKVDSTNIDMFWLEGESKISQLQQIDFLKRLYLSKLPIFKRTETIMKKMMVIEKNDQYTLSGKTGWSVDKENNGWFVGYVETQNKTYFFASNMEPKKQFDMNRFPMVRKDITYKALKEMKIIK